MQRRAFFKALCTLIGATLVEPSRVLAAEPKAAGLTADGEPWEVLADVEINLTWRAGIDGGTIMLGVHQKLEPGVVYTLKLEPPHGDTQPSSLVGIRSFNSHGEVQILAHEDLRGPIHHAPDMGFFQSDDVFVPCHAVLIKDKPMKLTVQVIGDCTTTLHAILIIDVHPRCYPDDCPRVLTDGHTGTAVRLPVI